MEASALPASVGLARPRLAFGASLLRIRSDDQLVASFRDGSEDAFRIIHDRYRSRLHAYTRQMLAGSPHDSEDALQEIFMRAYCGLRANRRNLALRPWLYRVAHNRCVDDLRRQPLVLLDPADADGTDCVDPAARVEQRDALRQLIADVQRLPDQQRSALLMRELSGMTYADVAAALDVSVPAVKSLLVRARVGLAQATEARDTSCGQIREELILAHDRGVRASGLARRHLTECTECRVFRAEIRGVSRQLAALTPTLGPLGIIANLLGIGGGGVAGSSAAAGGVAGGAGAAASAGLLAGGAGHVVTLLAAAVVTAGGAVEIQKTITAPGHHVRHHVATRDADPLGGGTPSTAITADSGLAGASTPATSPVAAGATGFATAAATTRTRNAAAGHNTAPLPLTQILDPDHMLYRHMSLGTSAPNATATTPASPTAAAPGAGTATPGPAIPPTSAPATPNPVGGPGSTAAGSTAPGSTPTGVSGTTPPAVGSSGTASSAPSGSSNPPAASGGAAASTGQTGAAPASGSASPTTATTGSGTSATAAGRTGPAIAKTVAAGRTLNGRVITFTVTRRHAPHRFALGTLLPR